MGAKGKTKRQRIPREKRTAYHEAGHTVMAVFQEVPFKSVSVVPTEEAWGVVLTEYAKKWKTFRPSAEMTPATRVRIEKLLLCAVAGGAAEEVYLGGKTRHGDRSDRQMAI